MTASAPIVIVRPITVTIWKKKMWESIFMSWILQWCTVTKMMAYNCKNDGLHFLYVITSEMAMLQSRQQPMWQVIAIVTACNNNVVGATTTHRTGCQNYDSSLNYKNIFWSGWKIYDQCAHLKIVCELCEPVPHDYAIVGIHPKCGIINLAAHHFS